MNTLSPALIKWMNSQTTELRKHPVGINWYSLDNSRLIAAGVSPNKVECWSDMFSEDDGTLKEPWYLNDLFVTLFTDMDDTNDYKNQTSENRRSLKRLKRNIQSKMIEDADTIICLPNEKRIHRAVEKILIKIASATHHVYVMNGDETTNATCEELMVERSKKAREKNKKCIFLTSLMGIRSWSNKYVKNVILLFDSGSFDTNTQRIARAWTPWYDKDTDTWHETCSIFDFRLSYDTPSLMERHICGILENKENFSKNDIDEFAEMISSSDKIAFFDYKDTDSKDPFRTLGRDDIVKMLGSNISFTELRLRNLLFNKIDKISVPSPGYDNFDIKMISAVENTNTKGDKSKRNNISSAIKQAQRNTKSNDKEELNEQDLKYKYINLVLKYGYLFNFDRVKEKPLQTICERIDTYKTKSIFKRLYFDTIKDILLQINEMHDEFDNIFIWQ